MFGTNYFGIVDYLVLLSSLIICLVVGIYYVYFSKHTNEELLIGGRDLKMCPVAASLMVSFFSAITILGYPAEIYSFGIEIFMQAICQGLGIIISGIVFVPFFYETRNGKGNKLTSIYEYLELRFESLTLRRIGALIFIMEQLLLAGMILYAPSIAMESFFGLPMAISIFGMGICCTLYTSLGGLKAVIWTDTFQFVLMIVGLSAILTKGFMDAGGVGNAFSVAYDNGRLNLFNFSINPFMRHNVLNFFLGSCLVTSIRTGVHQLQVQRYMSLPTVKKASRAVWLSVPFKMTVMTIMMLTGIALYAANADCDPVQSKKLTKMDQLVATFVIERLSFIPGSLGLFAACIFSGVLSSLSSMLNSLAAVTWEDYLSRHPRFKKMGPRAQTNVSRYLSFGYGLIAMFLAFIAQFMGAIYAASFAVTGVTSGAICGVFLMGIFMPFVNKFGAGLGTLIGLVSLSYVCGLGFAYPANKVTLPTSVDGCSSNVTMGIVATTSPPQIELGFPDNLSKLSYILYPFVGSLLACLGGCIISGFTGGFSKQQLSRVNSEYIHPWVRRFTIARTGHREPEEMVAMNRTGEKFSD